MEKITIVCCWWGNWCAPNGPTYVERLKNMFAKHCTIPHDFVCFTDRQIEIPGVEFRQIPQSVLRWHLNLPKFWIYSPDCGLSGRVVLSDLDSIIVGNMDEMMSYNGPWCGIKPVMPNKHHIGGGLLSYKFEKYTWLWDEVSTKPGFFKNTCQGKERLVYEKLITSPDRWQTLYPGQLVTYKKAVRPVGHPPKDSRFIAFHGTPRPHEVKHEKWIKEFWV